MTETVFSQSFHEVQNSGGETKPRECLKGYEDQSGSTP